MGGLLAIMGAIIGSPADIPQGIVENANPDDDCCEPIYEEIRNRIQALKEKWQNWNDDSNNLLPSMPPRAKREGNFSGHVNYIWNQQRGLAAAIRRAEEAGCFNYSSEAKFWANRQIPFNGMNKWGQ